MNKRYLKTLFLTLATLAPLTLLPGGAQAAEEYVLPDGGTLSIDEHGTCTAVTNNSGNDLMVPTKTANEWSSGGSSFLENAPVDVETLFCCTGGPQQLVYSGGSPAFFGKFATVNGDWAILSSWVSGGWATYFFKRTNGVWSQNSISGLITGAAINGSNSVEIYGDTAVIGAPDYDSGSGGVVYIFTRSGDTWTQQGAPLAIAAAYGGTSVSIDKDTIVVGNLYGGTIAHVYTRSGTTWSLEATLSPSDGVFGDYFGTAVKIDGDTIVVGAYKEDSGLTDNGAAYVFTRSGTTWTEQAKLLASDKSNNAQFGTAVEIDGDTIVVGAAKEGYNERGSAYVFTRSGTTWTEQAKIVASPPTDYSFFGNSLSLFGDKLFVSSKVNYTTYVYTRSGTTWSQTSTIPYGGMNVVTDGLQVLVGGPGAYVVCMP